MTPATVRAVRCFAIAVLTLAACARPRGGVGARAAALRVLFREREQARRLVLWADMTEPGPVFAATGVRGGRVNAATGRAVAEALGVPVVRVTAADMARLFREHPDGWAAFYARYPGAPGLVEVGPVDPLGDGRAAVAVGRSCGEHCRNAWRVELRAGGGPGGWRAAGVRVLRAPE